MNPVLSRPICSMGRLAVGIVLLGVIPLGTLFHSTQAETKTSNSQQPRDIASLDFIEKQFISTGRSFN